jgi:hypothetical protein
VRLRRRHESDPEVGFRKGNVKTFERAFPGEVTGTKPSSAGNTPSNPRNRAKGRPARQAPTRAATRRSAPRARKAGQVEHWFQPTVLMSRDPLVADGSGAETIARNADDVSTFHFFCESVYVCLSLLQTTVLSCILGLRYVRS